MGITKSCLIHYEGIFKSNILNFKNCKIIEMGAQRVHFEDKEFFENFLEKFGLNKNIAENFKYDMSGKFMHESFGHEYDCVDLDDYNGDKSILKWDLNTKICPKEYKNRYDLCTNFGTTEHLLNQTNVFRFMHDVVKKDGIILHILPIKDINHGLFNYNPIFFEALAKCNNYEIIGFFMTDNFNPNNFIPYNKTVPNNYISYNGTVLENKLYIHCTFKKLKNNSFNNLSQIFSSGIL